MPPVRCVELWASAYRRDESNEPGPGTTDLDGQNPIDERRQGPAVVERDIHVRPQLRLIRDQVDREEPFVVTRSIGLAPLEDDPLRFIDPTDHAQAFGPAQRTDGSSHLHP